MMMILKRQHPSSLKTGLLLCLLFVVVAVVWGQDDTQQQQQQQQCDCANLEFQLTKCVDDWRAVDAMRQGLEEQVRQSEYTCTTQLEQVRIDMAGQLEQTQLESNSQMQQAREELAQCQTQHSELTAHMAEQGNSFRGLQETSQQLEQELVAVQSVKSKLEKDLSDRSLDLEKTRTKSQQLTRDLHETKKTLEEMIAAKTIITIDYDLLKERIEEIKKLIMEYVTKCLTFLAEQSESARKTAVEFWNMLETQVFPTVERFVMDDAIPFWQAAWKQAKNNVEDLYAPHRPTVDKHIKQAKKGWNTFYKQNLESSVKEYKVDQYLEIGKSQIIEHAAMAHDMLVDGVKTWSSVAHKFAKIEDFPPVIVKTFKNVNSNAEIAAFYMECFLGFLLVRFLLKLLFRKKKIPKKVRMTKKQWQEKQEMEKIKGKEQQNLHNNKSNSPKVVTKNVKKNK
jgi:hypothetical protein